MSGLHGNRKACPAGVLVLAWMALAMHAPTLAAQASGPAPAPVASAALTVPQTVEQVRLPPVAYEQVADGSFRRAPSQALPDLVGARVEEVSPKGYVRVATAEGTFWVGKSSVKLSQGQPFKARCGAVSSASDAREYGVRGAGEGCK